MSVAKANGIHLYYEMHGEGEPLVLMTGVGQWSQFWYRNVPEISAHFQVIAFDNRGVGNSDKPDIPYDIPMLVADLLGLMDALGLERPHLAGHSLGGLVSLELAMSHPDRIGKLVVMSSLYPGPNFVPWTEAAGTLLFDRRGDPLDLVKRGIQVATAPGFEERDAEGFQKLMWLRFNSQQSPELYLRQSTSGLEYLKADHLRAIDNPVLLLYGAQDEVVPARNGEMIAAGLPHATLQLIQGAGHVFPLERPAETNQAIVSFLK